MTQRVPRVSAIALGAAVFLSLTPLSIARADTSAEPAPTPRTSAPAPSAAAPNPTSPNAAAPSLAEPAPTPGLAESGPRKATLAERPHMRHYAHHYTRHYAWRDGHRHVAYSNNPVAAAANGAVGAMADLGSIAAYPIYCFPDYGSCPVHWYRY